MKSSFSKLAAAVSLTLVAGGAYALPNPGYGSGPPATGANADPIVLSIFDPTTSTTLNFSDIVNVGYLYTDVTSGGVVSGAFTPDGLVVPFVSAPNPTGASGNVLQLDFGTVPGFTATFGSSDANATYWVTGFSGAVTTIGASTSILVSQPTSHTLSGVTNGGVNTADNGGLTTLNAWVGSANFTSDTSGSTATANNAGKSTWSQAINNAFTAQPTGAVVGNALNMYKVTKNGVASGSAATITEFANAQGAGFWFLTAAGDLTWNLLEGAPSVPLPAAAWLLLSGLAGLGVFGRRRAHAVVA